MILIQKMRTIKEMKLILLTIHFYVSCCIAGCAKYIRATSVLKTQDVDWLIIFLNIASL